MPTVLPAKDRMRRTPMSNERRQYVLDTDDGRRTFTARLIFDGANDTISYVDIEDYRYIPRPKPELESGDNK